MGIALLDGTSRAMQGSDKPGSALHLVADPLGEFSAERVAPRPVSKPPVRPAVVPPAPDGPAAQPALRTLEARRAPVATVAHPVPGSTTAARRGVWSFASGIVCGMVLAAIGLSSLTDLTTLRPEPGVDAPVPPPSSVSSPVQQPASQASVGSLQIDSTPQGAQVFVDRRAVGVTPLVLSDLAVGTHAIRVEAEGQLPWSSAIGVDADRRTDVRAILAPALDRSPRRRLE